MDRAAYLVEACKDDAELRSEVESLLAQDASKPGTLDRPAWDGLVSPSGSSMAPITSGTQLGPYKIEGPLGEGGMGEVFRGVDTRLGRSVAVKTSREQFSARFDREARAISSLNHPNICTLYDVGPNFLVMELCEGETLAARVERGKLSIQETLRYGAQIADALAAAHAKGIVHRDLKPGNVMLTKAGVKVLDFGLAKSSQDETLTGSHVVMGTPAYMAPEQREGKQCDARTDIYASGLILYEMASGKRWQPDQPAPLDQFPPTFAHVVERCLERDPEDRWQSARDIQRQLEWSASSRLASPPVIARQRINFIPWAVAGALALGLASVTLLRFREKPSAPAAPVRFQIPAPGNGLASALLSLSPDGRKLAFIDGLRLRVHFLDSGESRDLTAASGTPVWSPDSRFVAYTSQRNLMKIDVTGGPPQTVTDLGGSWGGGAWSRDGLIVFSVLRALFRVPASGGVPVQITTDSTREVRSQLFPWFLPDGRHFLYTRRSRDERKSAIYVGSVDAKPEQQSSRPLLNSFWGAEYAPSEAPGSGYLLFMREDNTLMAQPFDNRRLDLTGQAVPVAEQLSDGRAFSASANDVLVFQQGSVSVRQLTWYDREGKPLGTVGDPGEYQSLALSPDGTRLAVSKRSGQATNNIWLLDLTRGTSTRFTFGSARDYNPVWSPDGNRMVFSSDRDGSNTNLYQKLVSGTKEEEVLLNSNESKMATSWSRDGRFLLYTVFHPGDTSDIWLLPLVGDKKPVPFVVSEFTTITPDFSPDGHWVAYMSNESGRMEVYVRSFSMNSAGTAMEAGGKWQVSNGAGLMGLRWRNDGRELYYRSIDGKMMAVAIDSAPMFRMGKPRPYGLVLPGLAAWVSNADGTRFLVPAPNPNRPPAYTLVVNWQAGLKK